MEEPPYKTDARAYLQRARCRLNEGTREALFYAAFELRCGVEARLQQYGDAHDELSRQLKRGWQIEKLAKGLDRVFQSGDKIVALELWDSGRKHKLGVLYYTPVGKDLRKDGQKLGELLHALKFSKCKSDEFWEKTRQTLEQVARALDSATVGTLLGPPLRHPETGEVRLKVEGQESELMSHMKAGAESGESMWMKVEYFNRLPGGAQGAG